MTKAETALKEVFKDYKGPDHTKENESAFLDNLSNWISKYFGNINVAQQINIIRAKI